MNNSLDFISATHYLAFYSPARSFPTQSRLFSSVVPSHCSLSGYLPLLL